MSFTSVQSASATDRIAVTTAVIHPRIESRGMMTGRSSHTRITAARIAAYVPNSEPE